MPNQDDIDLAVQGVEAWNEWAQRCPLSSVDFSDADLTGISFAGFQFPGRANFHGITFSGPAIFRETRFSGDVSFSEAIFSSSALFDGSKFFGEVFFHGTEFLGGTSFRGSIFSKGDISTYYAYFSGAKFTYYTDFDEANFITRANFDGAEFFGRASFIGIKFLDVADFIGVKFSRGSSFHNASFEGRANFSDCNFDGQTDFRVKSFAEAPRFPGISARQGIQFGNIDDFFADFVKNGDEGSYRALKLSMGQQQARTEETAFAALELKARRYRLKSEAKKKKLGWQRFLSWAERCGYWLWEKCSKSGRGFLRPLTGYLLSWGAFTASYVLPCQGWRGDWWAGIHYAFLKQFPFAAAFRGGTNHFSNLEQALFAAPHPPGWVTALNSAQSLFALTLIFLMGLGIRHKFRLR